VHGTAITANICLRLKVHRKLLVVHRDLHDDDDDDDPILTCARKLAVKPA